MRGLTVTQIFAIVTHVMTMVYLGTGNWIPSDVDTCLENVGIKLQTECAGQEDIVKYHCLPYHFTNDFGYICIAWKWISPDHCPYLNSYQNQLDERKCESEFNCPKKQYKSYESYKYKGCFGKFKSTTSLPLTTTKKDDLTKAVTTHEPSSTQIDVVNATNGNGNKNGLQENTTVIAVVIFVSATSMALFSILLTLLICKWKQPSDIEKGNEVKTGISETSSLMCGSAEGENAHNKTHNKNSQSKAGAQGGELLISGGQDSKDKNEESNLPKVEDGNLPDDTAFFKPEAEIKSEENEPLLSDVAQGNEEMNKETSVEKLTETDKQIKLHLAALMGSVISRLLCTMIDNLTNDSFEKIVQGKDVKEYLTEKFKSKPYILVNLYISDDEDDNDEEMADESINRADVPVEVLLSILEDMIPELKTEDKNEIKTLKEGRDYLQNIDDKKPMIEFEKIWEKTKACIEHLDRKYESGIYDELHKSERQVRETFTTKRDGDQDSDVDDSDLSVTTAKEMKLQKFMKLAQIIGDAIFRLMCTIVEEEPGSQIRDLLYREDIKEFLYARIESHEYTLLYGEDDKPAMENLTFNIVFYIGVECLNLPVETVTEIKRLKTGRTYFDSLKGTEDEEEIKEKWIELAKSVKVLDDRYETGVYKDLCEHAKQYMPKLE